MNDNAVPPKIQQSPLVGQLLADAIEQRRRDDPTFSQRRLADQVGMSQAGISRIISGERTASEQTIAALSRELGAAFPLPEAWAARQTDIALGLEDERQRAHAWTLARPFARLSTLFDALITTHREQLRRMDESAHPPTGGEPH